MEGIINFEAFLITGILLNLTPGNDTIFILSQSISNNKKAGIVAALGIGTGSIFHTILAALGLSIIIAKSLFLFNLIKYAGAVYLFYIGYKMLTNKSQINTENGITEVNLNYMKVYRDSILTNVLNPKVALFFMAFLPQFINSNANNTISSFVILGITFTITGTIWGFMLALFASTLFIKLKNNQRASQLINRICGLTLIGLGIKVVLTNRE